MAKQNTAKKPPKGSVRFSLSLSAEQKKAKTEIIGLRPGEKLHEDMLSKTELDSTYEVPDSNLLQIRPQYTHKKYKDFKKYHGQELNSSLWLGDENDNLSELISLIKAGLAS